MIQIHKLVGGVRERTFTYVDRKSARHAYEQFQRRDDCYAQVVADGEPLNTAGARRFFRMRKIHPPRTVK